MTPIRDWIVRSESGSFPAIAGAASESFQSLTVKGADGDISYWVPVGAAGEPSERLMGRAALLASRQAKLAAIHPLIPPSAGPAWIRPHGDAPWLPTYGFRSVNGTPLAALIDTPSFRPALFWSVVPAIIDLLRSGLRHGLTLTHLRPEQILIKDEQPVGVTGLELWQQRSPTLDQDATRVAAQFIHWFLCALQQKSGGAEIAPSLWVICSRGLDGLYARSGLFKMDWDLRLVSRQAARRLEQQRRLCLLVDLEGVRQTTGALLDPWRLLDELAVPGETFDPFGVVLPLSMPASTVDLWAEAGYSLFREIRIFPESLTRAASKLAEPGQEILLVAGGRDLQKGCAALRQDGHKCSVVGFESLDTDQVQDGMLKLRPALYLA